MEFFNRKEELRRLTGSLAKPPNLIVVYGRRRIGKSSLLQQVVKDNDIYYLADLQEDSLQRNEIVKEIGTKISGFDSVIYPDWTSIFRQLKQRDFKGSLFIDEFPYLVKQAPEVPSIIQKLIDKKEITYNLILCGSSQQMMKGMFLNSSSPLYGRAREILKIYPLGIYWLQGMLKINPENVVSEYSVWGGIPRYWQLRAEYKNLEEALKNLVLDPLGILHEEPLRLFLDEMRTAIQPLGILTAIAGGSNRVSEISGRLGKPLTQLTRPIQQLIELNFLRREIPFGENEKSTKKSLYKIDDPFLNFYFSYISPNRSLLEIRHLHQVEQKIKKSFHLYVSHFYEHLCRQAFSQMNIEGLEIGEARRWWGANSNREPMEIDIVAESADKRYVITGEVKWTDNLNEEFELQKLIKKSHLLPFVRGREIIPCLFVKKKAKKNYSTGSVFDAGDVVNGIESQNN